MTVEVVTFGCRLNTADSEVVRRAAAAAGSGDTIVFNTCAVTAEAVRQARQAVRRARRERPEARIVVTGCAAQAEPETFAAMAEVDHVLGNVEKLEAERWRGLSEAATERVQVQDIFAARSTTPHGIDAIAGRTRAFLQVQTGCDHRCTFCVIPFGRGNARSVPMGATVDAVRRVVANGCREVVLTGVDITSYGGDLPGAPRLGRLVKAVLTHVPELERLRLSSLDSVEVDDDLRDAIATEPRLMPHLHLSLQAGDDLILKRMKRRHARADAIRLCAELRGLRPDLVFGADLIAGFPTETEAQFERSLDLVEACSLSHLHVFPYSPRPGTPAARMPQVPAAEIAARAQRLRAAGRAALRAHLASELGRTRRVLVERGGGIGRIEAFTPARLSRRLEPGTIAPVRITGHDDTHLIAEAA
jgi:threonylcarbamoyladenosine tRNA methylthiotransferase MtaB